MELKGPQNSLKHSSQPTLSQCPDPLLHCNSDSSDRASPPLNSASVKVILPNHTLSHWILLQEHILLLPWSTSWSVPGSPGSSAWRWAMKERVHLWLMRSLPTGGKQKIKEQNKCWIPSGSHIEISRYPFQKIKPKQAPQQQKTQNKTKKIEAWRDSSAKCNNPRTGNCHNNKYSPGGWPHQPARGVLAQKSFYTRAYNPYECTVDWYFSA